MNERPAQPPEGKLIAAATERAGLSIREASRRAGISYGRWRQITTGVQHVSPGEFAAVRAPARTLAKMAAVVGITPEQMATEGRAPRCRRGHDCEPLPPRPAPALEFSEEDLPDDEFTPEEMAALQDYADEFKVKLARARQRYPGERLTGELVFPRDPVYAQLWDILADNNWPAEVIPRAMAAVLMMRDESGARVRQRGRVRSPPRHRALQ